MYYTALHQGMTKKKATSGIRTGESIMYHIRFKHEQDGVIQKILAESEPDAKARGLNLTKSDIVRELIVTHPKYLKHTKEK